MNLNPESDNHQIKKKEMKNEKKHSMYSVSLPFHNKSVLLAFRHTVLTALAHHSHCYPKIEFLFCTSIRSHIL